MKATAFGASRERGGFCRENGGLTLLKVRKLKATAFGDTAFSREKAVGKNARGRALWTPRIANAYLTCGCNVCEMLAFVVSRLTVFSRRSAANAHLVEVESLTDS